MKIPLTLKFLLRFSIVALVFMYMVYQASLTKPSWTKDMNKPLPIGSPDYLIQQHDCWKSGQEAEVEVPGHVVLTKHGDVAPTYGGSKLAGKALEQVFDGIDHGFEIHGFCR